MKSLFEVFSKNPEFFVKKIIIYSKTKTSLHQSLGVTSHTDLETNIDFNLEDQDVLVIRLVQALGLLTEFARYLAINSIQGDYRSRELKPEHLYTLTIEIGHENVQVIEKDGFGWIFYNRKDMSEVVNHVSHSFSEYLLSIPNLKPKYQKVVQDIVKIVRSKFTITTNEVLTLYASLMGFSL